MKKATSKLIVFGVLVLLALTGWRYFVSNRDSKPEPNEIARAANDANFANYTYDGELNENSDAPDLNLFNFDGQLVNLYEKLKDKPVLVSFWSAKTDESKTDLVTINEVAGEYKNKAFVFGINRADDQEKAKEKAKELGLSFENLWNPDDTAAQKYKVGYMPETFIIGKDRKIKAVLRGISSKKDLTRALNKAL